ncbi:hypothetical protein ABH927_003990 [Planotetraspora sp. GP83]
MSDRSTSPRQTGLTGRLTRGFHMRHISVRTPRQPASILGVMDSVLSGERHTADRRRRPVEHRGQRRPPLRRGVRLLPTRPVSVRPVSVRPGLAGLARPAVTDRRPVRRTPEPLWRAKQGPARRGEQSPDQRGNQVPARREKQGPGQPGKSVRISGSHGVLLLRPPGPGAEPPAAGLSGALLLRSPRPRAEPASGEGAETTPHQSTNTCGLRPSGAPSSCMITRQGRGGRGPHLLPLLDRRARRDSAARCGHGDPRGARRAVC